MLVIKKISATPLPANEAKVIDSFNTSDNKHLNAPSIAAVESKIDSEVDRLDDRCDTLNTKIDNNTSGLNSMINAINDRFALLTGTVSINNTYTGTSTIDYPTGFNENNCVVISGMVTNMGTAKYSYGRVRLANSNQGNSNPSVVLSTNSIIINVVITEQTTVDIGYKVVLMKIS